MNEQFGIREILTNHPIVPVCVEDDPARIERVMEKLEASGIHCIEITLRSAGAFEVIQKALEVRNEGFSIGVGTIISSEQVERCATLGVDFMVSPGLTSHLADAFKHQIDVSDLPTGIYVVQITTENGEVFTSRLIKG